MLARARARGGVAPSVARDDGRSSRRARARPRAASRDEEERGAGDRSDRRFASEAERRRAVERLAPRRDGKTAGKDFRSMGRARSFGGGGGREDGARAKRAERAAERKTSEAREMMGAMRAAILEVPEVEVMLMREFEASPGEIAKCASAAFERLVELGYGNVESFFAVLSWMNDALDDVVDDRIADYEAEIEAEAREREARDPKARKREKDEASLGIFASLSSALREWFSIDINELEDGRKEVVVNASAEFLALFVVLLVASSKFGGDLVAAALQPDPLLR